METKQYYKRKCVITEFDSAWGPLIAEPGIETCHIVLKAMFEIELSTFQKWNAVNCPNNYHNGIFQSQNIRQLALSYPSCEYEYSVLGSTSNLKWISHKIRFFIPIKPLEGRNDKTANFSFLVVIDNYAIKWHYQQTVVKNMCALLFRQKSGARRFFWCRRSNSTITMNEEEHPEVRGGPQAIFPARTPGSTAKRTSAVREGRRQSPGGHVSGCQYLL